MRFILCDMPVVLMPRAALRPIHGASARDTRDVSNMSAGRSKRGKVEGEKKKGTGDRIT